MKKNWEFIRRDIKEIVKIAAEVSSTLKDPELCLRTFDIVLRSLLDSYTTELMEM